MRFFALALVFTVAACDDNPNNNGNDLTMEGDLAQANNDLSMNSNDDLSMPDLLPLTPSGMIQQVRNAGDSNMTPDGGMLAMSLPIQDAYVTYLRPNIPGQMFDPPGFYVQADPTGPAVFVAVTPSSLSPAPQVGDKVNFTVTGVNKNSGVHQVTSLTAWAISSSGNSLTTFVQDLTAATDLVTGVVNYESELSKVDLTVTSSFSSASAAYVAATATTTGVTTAGAKLKVRLPQTVRDSLDLTSGCVVTVGPTPMSLFTGGNSTTAEPSGWVNGDFTIASCPAPKVVSARATDATHVVVTFDRSIITSPFAAYTFNGLTASAATASNNVIVTTTAQTSGTLYTVTVDNTVKDNRGVSVDATHNTALFHGFAAAATLQINEFTPGISGGYDLVELKALTGGSVSGFTFQQDLVAGPKVLATLPDQFVAINDLIVLHIQPSPSPSPIPTNEIALITDCTSNQCYTTAWDAIGTADIGNSARVLVIKDSAGNIQDGVPFYKANADADAIFITEMNALVTAGKWTCVASPCVRTDAPSSTGAGNSFTGKSLKRTGASGVGSVANWPTNALSNSNYGQ